MYSLRCPLHLLAGSMGSSRAWDPADCSRICFAMVALACVVDSHVAAGDWVHVTAFSSGVETIKPWFCKPGEPPVVE
jgi:hypothetical protein